MRAPFARLSGSIAEEGWRRRRAMRAQRQPENEKLIEGHDLD